MQMNYKRIILMLAVLGMLSAVSCKEDEESEYESMKGSVNFDFPSTWWSDRL